MQVGRQFYGIYTLNVLGANWMSPLARSSRGVPIATLKPAIGEFNNHG